MSNKPNPRRANSWRRNQLAARHKATHNPCHICGQPIDPTLKAPDPWSFVVDEIIPVSRGGDPLSWTNTAPAHRWCNQVKSAHSLEWAQNEIKALQNNTQPQHTKTTSLPFTKLDI